MKVNLKKIGAVVAGATILASSAAFAGLMFGSTTLVDDNGAPVAKVVVGSKAAPSDGVAAALIAGKMVSETYKSSTLTAQVSGTAACTPSGAGGSGTCSISNEKARLEITVPGSVAAGTWTGNNLIGDYLNRELLDREMNTAGDADSEYPLSTSDTSANANPFSDGAGGDIGAAETMLYKIGGDQFSTFEDKTLTDDDSGNTYVEKQALWIKGYNYFSTDPDDVVGKMEFLAYSLKFDGPGGSEVGIPECTRSEQNDYAVCKNDVGDTTIDDATETHRLKIWFLGEEWIISEMNAPDTDSGTELTTESEIVNGGSIKIAKEAVAGILNQGENLPVDGLKFQLDDLEAHGEGTWAIISVLDANGNTLKKDKVAPGQTKEMTVNGKTYRFHVYKNAPGYTFGAKWSDVAIFAKELELVDAEELNEEEGNNEGYKVALGWKNLDAEGDDGDDDAPEPDDPDALRTVILYSNDIEEMTSSGTDELEEGDYVSIVQDPEVWKLSYKGLDLTSEDMSSLKFELKTSGKKVLNNDDGPDADNDLDTETCVIPAPYMVVSSGTAGGTFTVEGDFVAELSDDEFIVALNAGPRNDMLDSDSATPQEWDAATAAAAICDTNSDNGVVDVGDGTWPAGTVFMTLSQSSNKYGIRTYTTNGVEVSYEDIADGDNGFAPPEGGAILIESLANVNSGDTTAAENGIGTLVGSAYGAGSASAGTFFFAVAEKAGEGSSSDFVDYWVFGVEDTDTVSATDATFDFASTWAGSDLTSDDAEMLYGHATALSGDAGCAPDGAGVCTEFYDYDSGAGEDDPTGPVENGIEMVEEGYISERGSVLKSIDDDSVQFSMAHKLGKAQWYLAAASSSAADASKTIVTLAEGESATVSGVTVKVLEITEEVGACSAGTGSVSCTADMSGVSAVIMPNNAPSVTVATPYTGSYGPLVILDSDAVDVSTVVSVGGDKVNSVTAGLLQGSAVDWTAETKVVREVVQGSKIVVAGKEASDTLAAAQDFVAQVKKV
jgi:hypothetical protein